MWWYWPKSLLSRHRQIDIKWLLTIYLLINVYFRFYWDCSFPDNGPDMDKITKFQKAWWHFKLNVASGIPVQLKSIEIVGTILQYWEEFWTMDLECDSCGHHFWGFLEQFRSPNNLQLLHIHHEVRRGNVNHFSANFYFQYNTRSRSKIWRNVNLQLMWSRLLLSWATHYWWGLQALTHRLLGITFVLTCRLSWLILLIWGADNWYGLWFYGRRMGLRGNICFNDGVDSMG